MQYTEYSSDKQVSQDGSYYGVMNIDFFPMANADSNNHVANG